MQDAATWVAFNLPVGTVMTLMNNDTRSYQNIEGWGNTHQIDNFSAATFNDCMSSFRWDGLVPKKEIIAPFSLDVGVDLSNTTNLETQKSGQNNSDLAQQEVLTLKDTETQTVTITATETMVVTTQITAEASYEPGGIGGKLTVQLTYQYQSSLQTQNLGDATYLLRERGRRRHTLANRHCIPFARGDLTLRRTIVLALLHQGGAAWVTD